MNLVLNRKIKKLSFGGTALLFIVSFLVASLLLSAPKAVQAASPISGDIFQININISDVENCGVSCSPVDLSNAGISHQNGKYYLVDGSNGTAIIPSSLTVNVSGSSGTATLYVRTGDSSNPFIANGDQSGTPAIVGNSLQYSAYVAPDMAPLAGNPAKSCGGQQSEESITYSGSGVEGGAGAQCYNLDLSSNTIPVNSAGNQYVDISNGSLLVQIIPEFCPGNVNGLTGQATSCPAATKLPVSTGGGVDSSSAESGQTPCPSGETGTPPDCQSAATSTCQSTGGPLSWITCAVISGISTAEGKLENLVQDFLKTQPIDLNSGDCQSGNASQNYTSCIYNVWSEFRTYGDILLVIAVLVVVFGEAVGGGLIDAYTAKKMLPRILVAAILINLSIYIIAALEDVVNILGSGIYTLIAGAFQATGTYHINITAGAGNLFGATSLLGVLGAGGAIWGLAGVNGLGDALGFLALFVGLPALFAIIGVVLTIFFRSAILVFLLMISPVAFALYCLPNTQQYFKKWWELLFKTLLVYPIIMAIFAMCDVSAVIASSFVPGGEQWLGDLMSIVAVTAPLFLIPFAFKISGGAIGGLHGALTGFASKATEAIKGNPNNPNSLRNNIARGFGIRRNAAGLTGRQIGTRLNPRQITPQGRIRAHSRVIAQREAGMQLLRGQVEETGFWKVAANDSNIMRELALYGSGREARAAAANWRGHALAQPGADAAEIERQYNQRLASIGVAEKIGYNPASRRAALMNPNFIGFEVEPGQAGWNEAIRAMDDISGGDPFQFRSMMDEFQSVAKGPAGRTDVAANTDGNRVYDLDRATGNQSLYQLLNGKSRSTGALIDEHLERINDPAATPATRHLSAVFLNEMRNASTKNQGTGGNRDAINERLDTINVAYGDYVDSVAMAAPLPTRTAETVEVTVPTPGGGSETRREVQRVDISGDAAAQEAEARRQVQRQLDTDARSYTPPDINNVETP